MPIGVGIEFGQTVLRGAVVERRGAQAQLVRAAEVALPAPSELPAALSRLRKDLRVTTPAVLGLPTSSAVLATVHPLIVSPARAPLALHFELQQHLPYDATQAVWHYQWFTMNGRPATAASGRPAVVAAVKRAILDERLELCRRAGWAVRAVSVSALAVANAWLRRHETADAVVLHASGPLLELIAVGADGLDVLPMTLMETAGGESQPLLDALQSLWEHFTEARAARGAAAKPSAVWLAGDVAGSRGLVTALESRLGVSVKVLDPAALAQVPAGQPHPEQLVVPISLALQGLGQSTLALNLLVERQAARSQDVVRRGAWSVGALAGAAALWLGGQGMVSTLRQRESVLAALSAQERTYQTLRPELRGVIQQHAHVDRRLRQLRELAERRALLGEAMQRVVEALPEELWLTRLELAKEDLELTALLEGYATSFPGVTRLMDQLKSAVGWSKVKPLATSVTTDAAGKELIVFAVQSEQPLPGAGAAEAAAAEDGDAGGPKKKKEKAAK
jgi:Tfp pilus assembly PilM family ATPase/Tfp pilus assembly protein PilN